MMRCRWVARGVRELGEDDCALPAAHLPLRRRSGDGRMDMRHSTLDEADRYPGGYVEHANWPSARNERLWRRLTQVAIIVVALVVLGGALVAAWTKVSSPSSPR